MIAAGLIYRGSSPRVRGTRVPHAIADAGTRIIPAGAGHTRGQGPPSALGSDHPRGCGAHPLPAERLEGQAGSSPRVRGTLLLYVRWRHSRRIIPAGAGHTLPARLANRGSSDHPRGCGAHCRMHLGPAPDVGSSPRVRGTRDRLAPRGRAARIIPAGAGHTACEP